MNREVTKKCKNKLINFCTISNNKSKENEGIQNINDIDKLPTFDIIMVCIQKMI